MGWSSNRPDKPGWYWVIIGNESPQIVKIEQSNVGGEDWLGVWFFGDWRNPHDITFSVFNDCEWLGPLDPPE